MRKFFFRLIVLFLVIVGILIAAPSFIPAEVYRSPVADALARSTGRDVSIDGDVRLRFFPRFEILLQDVTVGNTTSGKANYFAKMEELDVVIDLLALLKGAVKVDRFELISPDINMENLGKGTPNWSFSPADSPAETPDTPIGIDLSDISLRDVRLVNGRVSYRDSKDTLSTYEGINVQFSLTNIDQPLLVRGSIALDDQVVNLTVNLDQPQILLDGGKSPISLRFNSALGDTAFDGTLTSKPSQTPVLAGSYDLDVPSLRRLSAALGTPIEGRSGFGTLKMSGTINATDDRILFQKAKLKFDGMTGEGDLALALTGARPKLTGTLALDKFDVTAFTSTSTVKTPIAQTGSKTTTPSSNSQTPSLQGWSSSSMDFSALRSLDTELRLSAGKIMFDKIKIGKGNLDLNITNGLLTAALGQVALYGGTGIGSLTINARQSTPRLTTTFTLEDINTLAFLKDAMDFDRLEGIGDISYSLATSGNSEKVLIRNLSGKGTFQIADGAWRGINLASLARSAKGMFGSKKKEQDAASTSDSEPGNTTNSTEGESPEETPEDTSNDSKTDFAEMTGTFTVQKGQASNTDLLLLNPFLRITGKGNVDLVKQAVKYRIRTKIVGDSTGQGGLIKAAGFTVPIVVKGNWDRLTYRPDLAGLITDNIFPGTSENADPISGLIEGIFGSKKKSDSTENSTTETPSDESAEDEAQPLRPEDIFKNLFGRSDDQEE